MRVFQLFCVALLVTGTTTCLASSPRPPYADADTAPLVSSFTVANKTEVPGVVLKPGDYSIQVVDHLSDRVILRIQEANGKVLTTFLGLPNGSFQTGAKGPVAWNSGPKGQDALRGFAFPGGGSVEFVYPKEEAVGIAKVNSEKVAAIDPASQGLSAEPGKLNKADFQILNLWLLSTTRVGPADNSQPAVQAERYQAPQPTQVAAAEPAPAPAPAAASESAPVQPAAQPRAARVRTPRPAPPASQQVASLKRPAGLAALPHTASDMPAIFLAGILALCGAGLIRRVRLSAHES